MRLRQLPHAVTHAEPENASAPGRYRATTGACGISLLNSSPAYITTAEAARYLGVSQATLEHWRQLRIGPRFIRIGRSIRYRVSDLDAYMVTHIIDPT